MVVGKLPNRFQLNDDLVGDEEVGKEVSQQRSVFVVDRDRMLLFDAYSLFAQSVDQSVFVDFFKMTVAEVAVKSEGRFSNLVTQEKYRIFGWCHKTFLTDFSGAFFTRARFLRLLRLFAANDSFSRLCVENKP